MVSAAKIAKIPHNWGVLQNKFHVFCISPPFSPPFLPSSAPKLSYIAPAPNASRYTSIPSRTVRDPFEMSYAAFPVSFTIHSPSHSLCVHRPFTIYSQSLHTSLRLFGTFLAPLGLSWPLCGLSEPFLDFPSPFWTFPAPLRTFPAPIWTFPAPLRTIPPIPFEFNAPFWILHCTKSREHPQKSIYRIFSHFCFPSLFQKATPSELPSRRPTP